MNSSRPGRPRVGSALLIQACVQVAVVEYARNVLKKSGAHSTEFDPECDHPVVIFMPEGSKTHMGGTMRLGLRATVLQTAESHAGKLYRPRDNQICERHRHRCRC